MDFTDENSEVQLSSVASLGHPAKRHNQVSGPGLLTRASRLTTTVLCVLSLQLSNYILHDKGVL